MPVKAPKGKRAQKIVYVNPEGQTVDLKGLNKLFRDVLQHRNGVNHDVSPPTCEIDLVNPLGDTPLRPTDTNPICGACGLFHNNSLNPFMPYHGSSEPLVTVVFDSVSPKEDTAGYITADGAAGLLKKMIDAFASETGVTSDDCRFVSLTRCSSRIKKPVALDGKGKFCRLYAVQDLIDHPPKLIMPVGSKALGLLCHKSNAQDWGGRKLTWRGWPDDWLTNPAFVKPRTVEVNGEPQEIIGHPLYGSPPGPDKHCILYPIQSPGLIYMQANQVVTDSWKHQIIDGLKLARTGAEPPQYDLPHYILLYTKEEVIEALQYIIDHPGMLVCYDTETEGLFPFMGERIVFMMFRFIDPETGEPVAFGFPWHYAASEKGPASPLLPYLKELRPYVRKALAVSRLIGHNLTFDILFSYANLMNFAGMRAVDKKGRIRKQWRQSQRWLEAMANAAEFDTWHMAYSRQQIRGSLGLEIIAYDFVPELAGYEEEFTLLIDLEKDLLHPTNGGHYARCPQELWESHFKAYVMGDVEVCYRARDAIQARLNDSVTYRIPISDDRMRGMFRYVTPPNRAWLYEKIMSPASRVLIKLMGRGMCIDQKVLTKLEREMPQAISDTLAEMKGEKGSKVSDYVDGEKKADPHKNHPDASKHWELDLENKKQLQDILYHVLDLPIQRLTKTGRKLYGEEPEQWNDRIAQAKRFENPNLGTKELAEAVKKEKEKYAAIDKFTLNKLAVTYEDVRPLQDYRKVHKLYTTYVRPLRNHYSQGIDKKQRTQMQHLCPGWLIHTLFMLTGTRGGRLSSRNPNLQQLPKKGYRGLNVKEMYVSRFGPLGCLYGADFSQIELRIMAAVSGDKSMVEAYLNDIDLHTLTASRLFKLSYETFSKEHRRELEKAGKEKEAKDLALKRDIAKTCNFLTGYGGGAFGLQTVLANQQIYWELDECENLIRLFFDSYPGVRDLLSYYKKFIEDNSVAVSLFGRVRVFEEVNSGDPEISSKALRAGCNHLIQSTASDMMLICLCVIEQMMRDEGLDSFLISTVHDSLVIDAVRSELPVVHEIVDTVLNNMPAVFKEFLGEDYDTSWMIVPFAGDSDVGLNYADMHGIPKGEEIDWDKLLATKAGN